jgi:Cu/Ag efflux protein CusF
MNKKYITAFVAGVSMCAIAAVGQSAQDKPLSPGKADAPLDSKSSVTKRANGEVTSVDAKSGKLSVKTSTEELKLDVQGSTAKTALANIKVGDKVNVAYEDKGGMLVANSVSKASATPKDGMGSPAAGDIGSKTKSK